MHDKLSIPWIAIAGPPNCGKSALFNALTGSRQKVANYPGATVERKEGSLQTKSGKKIRILDLPGTYSLDAHSPEEKIARDIILRRKRGEVIPDAIIAVADATNLERSLGLALELRKLDTPVVLALNMIDLANKRGLKLNIEILSQKLGLPVVPTVAVKNRGIDILLVQIESLLSQSKDPTHSPIKWESPTVDEIQARFNTIDEILKEATVHPKGPAAWTGRIDKILLHPVLGNFVMALILLTVFQAVFSWAEPFMNGIDSALGWLSTTIESTMTEGPLRSLLINGVLAGVGAVVIFLPQILFLFLFILLLEESGYMARAAFLMDRTMGAMGLHGRAFIPLLSSFACAIPGVMATRTIENRRDRIATILVAPLMTCSARLPVYTLLISAFIPNKIILGPIRLQGLVMFGLYVVSIGAALLVSLILKLTLLRGPKPALLLEMPTYKLPRIKNILLGLFERAKIFLKRAGTLILAVSICIWFLISYPKPPENHSGPAIQYSYAGKIGLFIEPAVRPIGFTWEIATGLIPGFAAREIIVSALATIYAVEKTDDSEETQVDQSLGQRLIGSWSLATALALLVWYIFSPQCLATFAVIQKETISWGWTAFAFLYMLGLAYLGAFITFQTANAFMGG